MITVRKVSEGVGVELILPVFSASIEKIELVKKASIRRSKLYYLRNLTSKKSRMKYKDISDFVAQEEPVETLEEIPAEKTAESEEKKSAYLRRGYGGIGIHTRLRGVAVRRMGSSPIIPTFSFRTLSSVG